MAASSTDVLGLAGPDGPLGGEAAGEVRATPLVIDLDGTLVRTDTLAEAVVKAVRTSPWILFRLPFWLLGGRAAFKGSVAEHATVLASSLPYNEPFLDYLWAEKAKGRRVILATAAHETIARAVADHLGLFDEVIATSAGRNVKGRTKLAAIQEQIGRDFAYAGDSFADMPIWQAAREVVLVGVTPRLAASVRRAMPVEREFPNAKADLFLWLRALRFHQWTKNLLLFVPLLTSFSFMDAGKMLTMVAAFVSFSLAASATYVANDLWDLDSDRNHPRKRSRPFASGRISIASGLAVAGAALAVSALVAGAISGKFLLLLWLYVMLTTAYSAVLKSYVLVDVFTLAILYTFRIVVGAVVAGVPTSASLLAFSVFLFLSLALVKRCSELQSLDQIGRAQTHGRDYRVSDLVILWPMGCGAALSAVVVFGLFISMPETRERYESPHLLGLVAIMLCYWLGRLWIKTSRGEMHDDPIVFAIKDHGSRVTVAAMVVVVLAAHYLRIDMLG